MRWATRWACWRTNAKRGGCFRTTRSDPGSRDSCLTQVLDVAAAPITGPWVDNNPVHVHGFVTFAASEDHHSRPEADNVTDGGQCETRRQMSLYSALTTAVTMSVHQVTQQPRSSRQNEVVHARPVRPPARLGCPQAAEDARDLLAARHLHASRRLHRPACSLCSVSPVQEWRPASHVGELQPGGSSRVLPHLQVQ
jgi:hypothetical protein